MSKITNKGQLTSIYNRGNELKRFVVKKTNKPKVDYDEIHNECYKPLQSKFAVEAHGKLRNEWYSHNTMNGKLKTNHFGSTWYEVDRSELQFHEVGSLEILREQYKLYRKLEREYKNGHNEVTTEDKLKAVTRKRNINLLQGLTSSPRYDRIYKEA